MSTRASSLTLSLGAAALMLAGLPAVATAGPDWGPIPIDGGNPECRIAAPAEISYDAGTITIWTLTSNLQDYAEVSCEPSIAYVFTLASHDQTDLGDGTWEDKFVFTFDPWNAEGLIGLGCLEWSAMAHDDYEEDTVLSEAATTDVLEYVTPQCVIDAPTEVTSVEEDITARVRSFHMGGYAEVTCLPSMPDNFVLVDHTQYDLGNGSWEDVFVFSPDPMLVSNMEQIDWSALSEGDQTQAEAETTTTSLPH